MDSLCQLVLNLLSHQQLMAWISISRSFREAVEAAVTFHPWRGDVRHIESICRNRSEQTPRDQRYKKGRSQKGSLRDSQKKNRSIRIFWLPIFFMWHWQKTCVPRKLVLSHRGQACYHGFFHPTSRPRQAVVTGSNWIGHHVNLTPLYPCSISFGYPKIVVQNGDSWSLAVLCLC